LKLDAREAAKSKVLRVRSGTRSGAQKEVNDAQVASAR
jgi:hypothetical protein